MFQMYAKMVGVAGAFFLGANLVASQVQSAQELSSRGLAQTPVPYEDELLVERTKVTQALAPVYEEQVQQEAKMQKPKKSCCKRTCSFCKKHPCLVMCGLCMLFGGIAHGVSAATASREIPMSYSRQVCPRTNQFEEAVRALTAKESMYSAKNDLSIESLEMKNEPVRQLMSDGELAQLERDSRGISKTDLFRAGRVVEPQEEESEDL